MGPDKKRLSKRHGATSVTEYQKAGYLAEAMVNFLALLGWSPGGDREVLSREELISMFTLEGISGGNAVFNVEKLDWFNQQHIARLDSAELLARVEPSLREAGLWRDSLTGDERVWILRVLDLLKPRVKKIDHLVDELKPLLAPDDAVEIDETAAEKHLTRDMAPTLSRLAELYTTERPTSPAEVEQLVRSSAQQANIKAASLIHATRVAVTGRTVSAGLFDLLAIMGVERVSRRLERAVTYIARR